MVIKKSETHKKINSNVCTVYEYLNDNKDLNVAFIEIKGRYPNSGWSFNEVCNEAYCIVSGHGIVNIEGKIFKIKKGDVVYIDKNKKFYVEGRNLKYFCPTSPAFYIEQYKHIEK
jgi:mannose-6-phosphate isomerase-like protein (cupin superfamily)